MIVAITAGTLPNGKKKITGIKYTKVGIVCIASSIGRITTDKILLKAINTPNGIPIARERITEINTMEIVVIVSGHKSNEPIKNMKNPKSIPPDKFVKYHPNKTIAKIKTHHGTANKADSNPLIEEEVMKNMKSKKAWKLAAKKLIKLSTPSPIGIRKSGNSFISMDCNCSRFLTPNNK